MTMFCFCGWTDGRAAPQMKGQLRRRQEREVLSVSVNTFALIFLIKTCFCLCFLICGMLSVSQRRIVMLNAEVDRGMEAWREKQEEVKKREEHKKSLLLKPKGKILMKKNSQS